MNVVRLGEMLILVYEIKRYKLQIYTAGYSVFLGKSARLFSPIATGLSVSVSVCVCFYNRS